MERKAVIKNADMSEDMQQDAVDCASQALEKYNIEKDIAAYVKKRVRQEVQPDVALHRRPQLRLLRDARDEAPIVRPPGPGRGAALQVRVMALKSVPACQNTLAGTRAASHGSRRRARVRVRVTGTPSTRRRSGERRPGLRVRKVPLPMLRERRVPRDRPGEGPKRGRVLLVEATPHRVELRELRAGSLDGLLSVSITKFAWWSTSSWSSGGADDDAQKVVGRRRTRYRRLIGEEVPVQYFLI